jgi:putative hydrolase of the HAD superfamily
MLFFGGIMINTIIFDLDDTLYNERSFVFGCFQEVCSYLSKKYDVRFSVLYESIRGIFREHGRGKIFNILCKKYNFDEKIDDLVNIYRNAMPNIKLYDDSRLFITKFRSKYNLGIITDGKASVQWNKIKLLGLSDYVDKIIVTDDYGLSNWKPNTFSYNMILSCFNTSPSQSIYVGDNPHKDFVGAKELGIHTVRIIRNCGDHMKTFLDNNYEADYNIYSLAELGKIIDIINNLQKI